MGGTYSTALIGRLELGDNHLFRSLASATTYLAESRNGTVRAGTMESGILFRRRTSFASLKPKFRTTSTQQPSLHHGLKALYGGEGETPAGP
jgi:hypothetical protein